MAWVDHQRELAPRDRDVAHLQVALATNRKIGAAIGVLMAQKMLPYEQALQLLLKESQNRNCKLGLVADGVLDTGALPGDE